jgi:pimeloyl-ACP methyl ester carboxylesterase
MAECEVHRRSGALRQGGVSEPAVTVAAEVWRGLFAVVVSGAASQRQIDDLEELLEQLRADPSVRSFEVPEYARASPMLSPMPPLGPAASVVEQLIGDPDREFGYDPIDSYRAIRCPVFLQFGSEDINLPSRLSAERIRAALSDSGNEQFTVTMYEGAGHLLELVPDRIDGMTYEQASYLLHNVRFVPGAIDELVNWTAARSAS